MARGKKPKRRVGATQRRRPLRAAHTGPPLELTRLEEIPHCSFLTLKVDLQNVSQHLRSDLPTPGLTLSPSTSARASSVANETPETEPVQSLQPSLLDSIVNQATLIHNAGPNSVACDPNFNDTTSQQILATIDNGGASMSNNFQDVGGVGTALKDVINDLFLIQSQVHDFHSDHQQNLNSKVDDLVESLANVQELTSKELSPNNPIHNVLIAPDIIDYVDDGRNPDIYTRDFVELVQRGNAVLNGRTKAFRDFSTTLAGKIKTSIPELSDEVDMIMDKASIQTENEPGHKQSNGSS